MEFYPENPYYVYIIFEKICFIFKCVCCMCVCKHECRCVCLCVCVHVCVPVSEGAHKGQRFQIGYPGAGATHGFWESNLGPPQEQCRLLTTEPSLQLWSVS